MTQDVTIGGPAVDAVVDGVQKLEQYVVDAAPHVWEATLAAVQIEAAWQLCGVVLMVAVFAACSRKCWALGRAANEGKAGYSDPGEPLYFLGGVLAVVAFVFCCALALEGGELLRDLRVPEFKAMQEVAAMVRGR